MVFSSLAFLLLFLPALCVLFYATPRRWGRARQYILLAFSLLFYGSGEPRYIFLIVGCIALTWFLSRYVKQRKKTALICGLLVNLVPLAVTKYAGFVTENLSAVLGTRIPFPAITMPIGISFYTFQVITFLVDLYRGKVEEPKNPLLFALYIMFFPQLIAGPIVKYEEVVNELENPDVSWKNIQYGAGRLIVGLGKKVLLANQAGYIASTIQTCPADQLTPWMTWLCVIAYTVQIYFDFSGYSEMAIGLGSMFGFHFPENFNDPYSSRSISDFWRRWHITLGRFFREYVYIPLGGNRVKKVRWIINIMAVWALTGLWHGAAWNYVIWGVYYGVLIILERVTGITKKLPAFFSWLFTFLLVMIGWGIFLCDGYPVGKLWEFMSGLFFLRAGGTKPATIASLELWGYLPFLALGFLLASPAGTLLRKGAARLEEKLPAVMKTLHDAGLILVLALSLLFLVGGTYNPFIYFRF